MMARPHPEVFVIGDLMSLNGLPGVAEVAMQSGRHASRTIVRRLRGEDTMREFRYHDLGTMATVSRFRAVASFSPVRVGGAAAWLLWALFVDSEAVIEAAGRAIGSRRSDGAPRDDLGKARS